MATAQAEDRLSFVFPVTGTILVFPISAGNRNFGQDFRSFAFLELVRMKFSHPMNFVGSILSCPIASLMLLGNVYATFAGLGSVFAGHVFSVAWAVGASIVFVDAMPLTT